MLSKNHISSLLNVFYLLILASLVISSYKNTNAIVSILHFDPRALPFLFFALLLFFKFKKIYLSSVIHKINNYIILPLSMLVVLVMGVLDTFLFPNYSFSVTNFHFDSLSYIVLFSFLIALTTLREKVLKKNWKQFILLSGFLLIVVAIHISMWPADVFKKISAEDNIIENTQFFVLISSSVVSFILSYALFKRRVKSFSLLFLAVGIALFFVAGDEISWGQRLLGIATPVIISSENSQGEITFHNVKSVGGFIPYTYTLIGFYGSFAWMIGGFFKSKFSYLLIPPYFIFPYFATAFLYNFSTIVGKHSFGEFSEFAELMLYMGILIFLVENTARVNKSSRKS